MCLQHFTFSCCQICHQTKINKGAIYFCSIMMSLQYRYWPAGGDRTLAFFRHFRAISTSNYGLNSFRFTCFYQHRMFLIQSLFSSNKTAVNLAHRCKDCLQPVLGMGLSRLNTVNFTFYWTVLCMCWASGICLRCSGSEMPKPTFSVSLEWIVLYLFHKIMLCSFWICAWFLMSRSRLSFSISSLWCRSPFDLSNVQVYSCLYCIEWASVVNFFFFFFW